MKAFLSDITTIKNITVSKSDEHNGIARFKLYNVSDDFDLDFTLQASINNVGDELHQYLDFALMSGCDEDASRGEIMFTPYSTAAITKLASLGCMPTDIGKGCCLSEGGRDAMLRLLHIMNEETYFNPVFQEFIEKCRDKVGTHFDSY